MQCQIPVVKGRWDSIALLHSVQLWKNHFKNTRQFCVTLTITSLPILTSYIIVKTWWKRDNQSMSTLWQQLTVSPLIISDIFVATAEPMNQPNVISLFTFNTEYQTWQAKHNVLKDDQFEMTGQQRWWQQFVTLSNPLHITLINWASYPD